MILSTFLVLLAWAASGQATFCSKELNYNPGLVADVEPIRQALTKSDPVKDYDGFTLNKGCQRFKQHSKAIPNVPSTLYFCKDTGGDAIAVTVDEALDCLDKITRNDPSGRSDADCHYYTYPDESKGEKTFKDVYVGGQHFNDERGFNCIYRRDGEWDCDECT